MEETSRFQFGKNWLAYLAEGASPRSMAVASESLGKAFGGNLVAGRSFLDVGSGSGIFSLAAYEAGLKVTSFDYDLNSVAATEIVSSERWKVLKGDLLSSEFLLQLSRFDYVYCWGVAHHTGDLWKALENLTTLVAESGTVVVAIYNDQGKPSIRWKAVKRAYVKHVWLRPFLITGAFIRLWGVKILMDALKGKPRLRWRSANNDQRGMTAWHDLKDWVGGYPFEVAKPEEVFEFFSKRGFVLRHLKTCAGGIGCNEYRFVRNAA